MKYEVRFSGTGGQGIIRCAVLLAEAALYDGYHAAQSQVYGPESRGGSSQGEVVIKDSAIYYPKVVCPDVLLCLSQEAYNKYAADIVPGGILIVDEHFVQRTGIEAESVKVYELPIVVTAQDRLQNEMSANVVALGAIVGLTEIVSDEAIERALANNFKAKVLPGNLEAYRVGVELARAAK
ncbi:MAG: 2-oxoacid:acceptor oxidoreductase family protein [Firmicutes bacterium]|nr:2-oxoacid:acceptor oxidoreductase family protein [Bacillota bacterium]MBQ3200022.1 2-oxoacid:acceptor oxidoreductase family protein [Bacillota bacterium]